MKPLSVAACLAALLLHLSAAQAQRETSLTLEDAIAIGKENNRLLRASGEKVDAASAKASEAHAALLPSVKLQAGYARLSDVDPFQVQLPSSPNPVVISPTVLNNYSVRVGVQQPLFTGFALSSNARASEFLAEASEADRRNDRADLVLGITVAYWSLYQTEQTKGLVDENVSRLDSYKKDTEHLLNAGMATRNDQLRIEVQLATARLQQIDATNDVQVAMMNLNTLLGRALDTRLTLSSEPTTGLEEEGRPVRPGGQSLIQSWSMRPDLLAMQSRLEASKTSVTAAEGGWLPQLSISGNYYYARPNQRYLPTRDEFKSTWDVGVSLQWDIWNWMTPLYRTEQARAQVRQQEWILEQAKENVALEVEKGVLAVERARKKIEVAGTGVVQAEENVRSLRDKYRQGLATSTELLDADVAVLQARTSLTAARVEMEVALARLKKARGME